MPLGHWARDSSSTPARSSLPRAVVTAVSGISLGNPRAGAGVAPAAGRGALVVERLLEEGHPARRGALVVEHESLLALACLADAGIALGVVLPALAAGNPAALDPRDRAVDVEDLEQELEARAPEVDDRLERHRGQGAGGLGEAESLELARKLGHERSIANSLSNIADIEATLGHHDVAETLARESLEINRRIGDDAGTGVALLLLAASMLERGSDEDAVPMIVESVRCFRTVDFKDFLTSGLVALARAEASSDPSGAALLLGAARTVRA